MGFRALTNAPASKGRPASSSKAGLGSGTGDTLLTLANA
jgi:hypothetical protein